MVTETYTAANGKSPRCAEAGQRPGGCAGGIRQTRESAVVATRFQRVEFRSAAKNILLPPAATPGHVGNVSPQLLGPCSLSAQFRGHTYLGSCSLCRASPP